MHVLKVVEHYGHSIVTANVDGDYDKRGLPDPLVLTQPAGWRCTRAALTRNSRKPVQSCLHDHLPAM
jgi:hypothetical protein